jgi:cytochrome c-type biogenesis protein CcmH
VNARLRCVLVVLALCPAAPIAIAAVPSSAAMADPVLEQRVQALAEQLRCLVCQNQSLADSHAPLAVDLKNQVREQVRAGRADAEVIDFMTQRYGDFVLYRPPFKATTALLWLGPALMAGVGLVVGARAVKRQARPKDEGATSR